MNRLDELLQRFHDGSLDAAGYEELLRLMHQPDARREWVKNAMIQNAVIQAQRRDHPSISTRSAIAVTQQSANESETRRIRSSRGKLTRRHHPSRFWNYVTSLVAAVLLVAGAAYFFSASMRSERQAALSGTIIELTGAAEIHSDAGSKPAVMGMNVVPGATIKTSSDTQVRLRYLDNTIVVVRADSELTLQTSPGEAQKRLQLERGNMSAAVTPQPAATPLLVETPTAVATVVGTEFGLSARAEGSRLEVIEGRVRYFRKADGQSILVSKGEYAEVRPGRTDLFRALPAVSLTAVDSPKIQKAPTGGSITLGTFESPDENWRMHFGSEFPGAKGSMEFDSRFTTEGKNSLRLSGDYSGGGQYVSLSRDVSSGVLSKTLAAIPDTHAVGIRLWVRSPVANGITLRVSDATGQRHQQEMSFQPSAEWQIVEFKTLAGGRRNSHWDGANDGVFHGPLHSVSFLLKKDNVDVTKAAEIWMDQIELVVNPAKE